MRRRKREQGAGSSRALGAAATGAGATLLATAASACCVPVLAPLVVSVLGVSGAVWAAGLKPYSPWILAVAGMALAFGFWSVYRPRPAADAAACPADRGRVARIPKLILWISAALWLAALALNLLPLLVYFVE